MTTTQSNLQPDVEDRPSRPTVRVVPEAPPMVHQAASPKRLSKLWLALPAIVVLAVFGVWQGYGRLVGAQTTVAVQHFTVKPMSFQVILHEKGELEAANSVDIKSEVEGVSTIITIIPEGATVKEGDLLIEMASDQIDERIEKVEIQVATAKAAAAAAEKELAIQRGENKSSITKAKLALDLAKKALEKYEQGDWVQDLSTAKLGLDEAKAVLERTEDRVKSSEKLYEQKFITRREVETDRFEHYKSKIQLEKAELALDILQKYDHEMQLMTLRSDIDEAEGELVRVQASAEAKEAKAVANLEARQREFALQDKQLTKYREQKAKTKILAPAPGLVVYARDRHWDQSSMVKEGGQVRERQTLIKLPDTSVMVLETRVHEAKSNDIALGQTAVVEIEGVPRRYTGKVTKISALADSRSYRWLNRDLKEYETEITLDEVDEDLKPGATGRCEILIGELQDVLAIPVQTVYSKGGLRFVFVRKGNQGDAEPVEVKLGKSSDEFVEVKSGLTGGEQVMMVVTEEMKQKLPEIGNGNGNGANAGPPQIKPPTASPGVRPSASPGASPKEKSKNRPKAGSSGRSRDRSSGRSGRGRPR